MNLHISTAFDSGAIDVISLADPGDIRLNVRADNASEFAQWFHFSLHGAAGVAVTLRFMNAGQCAFPKGWEGYRVVASHDRKHWFRIDTSFDGQVMAARLTPATPVVYFAYFEPYSQERHLDFVAAAAMSSASDRVQIEHLGQSLEGRSMTLLRIADPHATMPVDQRKKIWLIARQHPGEAMAEWFAEGFVERLLDRADPVARALLAQCVFYVVPNMNPDGAARGNLRTNAAGANLNREWQSPSLEKSPEVFWVRQKMQQVGVDLNLDAHGDEGLPYNFVVGTEGTAGYSPRIEALENAFKSAWQATCPDFQTAQGYGRTAPGAANMTLATNWIGQTFNCLAFTIEMPFKDNADAPDGVTGWSGLRSSRLGASVLLPILAVMGQLR
jgi:murein tripeptide amidase MpaA